MRKNCLYRPIRTYEYIRRYKFTPFPLYTFIFVLLERTTNFTKLFSSQRVEGGGDLWVDSLAIQLAKER